MKEATTNEQPEKPQAHRAHHECAVLHRADLPDLSVHAAHLVDLPFQPDVERRAVQVAACLLPAALAVLDANTLEYFKFWTYLKNTMIIIVPSVIFGTITATMCGYAFARLRFRLRNFLFTLCVGSMLLPTMVTLIPLYIMWTKFFNMSNTFWPLILPYLCGGGAFNIFLIRQFVRSIPRELDEAATIDGAGYFRILLNVIVPSIKSAMIVVAMFLFIQIWNDLLQQMIYINTDDKFTISMGLSQLKGSLKTDWSAIMCGTCMSFVPGVVFYLLGQRYFVEGIVMTGMKN